MAAPPYFTPDQQTAWSSVWNISQNWGRQAGPPPLQSAGLANTTGVICYLNSVLQCILHAPQFINWLENHHVNEELDISCPDPDCIACSLRYISIVYWQNDRSDFEINNEVKRYRYRHRQAGWQVDGQQDAHELYEHLITLIREQCVNENALLRALLTMETISILTCPGCSHVSRTSAVDNCMVCPFERSSSLDDLIEKVFETETIEGFRCENCGDSAPRERHHIINVPPEILVVQLNRFTYNPRTQGTRKKRNVITFPASLDLSDYCDGERKFTYGLFAVIKHFGNLNTGHYIVYTKGPAQQWKEINDTEVTPCTIEEALNPRGMFLPYVIFYQKEYQNDNSVAESPVSFSFASSEESSSEQSPAKISDPDIAPLRVSHQISERIIQLRDSDEENAPEIPSTLPSASQPPPVSEPSLPKTSTPRHSSRAQNANPLSTPATQYQPPSPTPPRSKKLPKYMIPEQPKRIQPHRSCRHPRREEEVQGPVRVQPRRSCRVIKNKKEEPKSKAKSKARKGKQARKNKKR